MLLLLGAASAVAADAATVVEHKDKNDEEAPQSQPPRQCSLYLAPSSTSPPDRIQPGVYAGRRYEASEPIGIGPELAVQLLDLDAHTGRNLREGGDEGQERPDYFAAMAQMLWTPDSTMAKYETDEHSGGPGRTFTVIPGVGMLGNFHPALINADWDENATLFRTVMEDGAGDGAGAGETTMGRVHPGRGGVTTYYNVTVAATQAIPAGMEIFLNFGQDWSDKALEANPMATRDDYDQADRSMDKAIEFFERHAEELPEETKERMYGFLVKDVIDLISPDKKKADILRSLLPESHAGLGEFKESGGGSLQHKNPTAFRDVSWLEANGRCLDNVVPGPSTVPYAGRGAFAARSMEEGDVVLPVPLMLIGHRKELDMYDLIKKKRDAATEEQEEHGDDDGATQTILVRKNGATAEPTSSQLLLNYCFGHAQSNLLLYPFGSGFNFINHRPTGDGANARVVWSDRSHGMHNPGWLELDPDELSDEQHRYPGLMFDVVATKKIEEGDEVFIDYGEDWQAEWDRHVERVKSADLEAGSWEPTALELNTLYHQYTAGAGYAKPFKTANELKDDPYPERVATACIRPGSWNGAAMRLCEVVERIDVKDEEGSSEMKYKYSVNIRLETETAEYKTVVDLPHESIHFVDKPYASDQSRTLSPFPPFRHHISIPDDILPSAWKAKKADDADKFVIVENSKG